MMTEDNALKRALTPVIKAATNALRRYNLWARDHRRASSDQEVIEEINRLCTTTLLDYAMVIDVVRLMAAASICGIKYEGVEEAILRLFPHHRTEIRERIVQSKYDSKGVYNG